VQRFEEGCDIRKFSSLNVQRARLRKGILNLLEAIYLGLRKIVIERVTAVKFGVANAGNDDTGCFRIN